MDDSTDTTTPAMSQADRITRSLLAHVSDIAEASGASAIFVNSEAIESEVLELSEPLRQRVYYVAKTPEEQSDREARGCNCIRVPNVPFTRMGQVKVAMFLGVSRGVIDTGDTVLYLAGLTGSHSLDTIIAMEVGRETELLSTHTSVSELPPDVRPEVLERILDIASELGSEGREGKPVGTIFVVGDTERVVSLSRPLILNPFRGYPEEERNVLDEALEETIKELAAIDGAFVVRGDGVVEACGVFLKTASQDEFELPRGLGARHHAAAGISSLTDSLAITVSESTGTVSVFRRGALVVDIEKPRQVPLLLPGA